MRTSHFFLSGRPKPKLLAWLALFASSLAFAQADPIDYRLVGDIGGAVYSTQSIVLSKSNQTRLLPYAYLDYGRFFARVDTFGLKTVKLGNGYLELTARVSQDGWRADTPALAGLTTRKTPIPIGLGTFQKTPYGAFFINGFVDVNKSHGSLFEATYVAEFKLGKFSIYPQLGLDYRSAKYNNYFYGVSSAESSASGFSAFNAGASLAPVIGLGIDVPISEPWVLNFQFRRQWLDANISSSPIVKSGAQNTGFAALSYRFK
jgi:outer membrane protein